MQSFIKFVVLGVTLCGILGCERGSRTGATADINPAAVQQEDAAVAEAEKAEAARQAQSAALP
jgi:hypothetical protein